MSTTAAAERRGACRIDSNVVAVDIVIVTATLAAAATTVAAAVVRIIGITRGAVHVDAHGCQLLCPPLVQRTTLCSLCLGHVDETAPRRQDAAPERVGPVVQSAVQVAGGLHAVGGPGAPV